jgi:hypothetical protein
VYFLIRITNATREGEAGSRAPAGSAEARGTAADAGPALLTAEPRKTGVKRHRKGSAALYWVALVLERALLPACPYVIGGP